MVKGAHWSLKASLMARCSDDNWKAQLPWVLLGLRTAPRSIGEPSLAKNNSGETIAMPGEFFPASSNENNQTPERIRNALSKFTLCHQTFNDTTKTFRHQDLRTCDFVFIYDDAHRPPLRHSFKGPYRVINRNPKAYLLLIHRRGDWVSTNRLKPAVIINNEQFKENTIKE
ncbi:uncharacterized protein [Palaemon carinicauda]|uniref:uncharacterized protein n=1 Tax=Palaemon carinicauda TaxID=392227 RepID=UPI0035B69FE5